MKLRKGMFLVFKDRLEVIKKANNKPIHGTIVTNNQVYSTDFIQRWLKFGFVKIKV
jgi:hypothetical protein